MSVSFVESPIVAGAPAAQLHVDRSDIVFRNVASHRVRIQVTVRNVGGVPSEPAIMLLQAAPLGAFVPWRDLDRVAVPSIASRSAVEVSTEVSAPITSALGEFSDVPPGRLLTAIAGDDEPTERADRGSPGERPVDRPTSGADSRWGKALRRMYDPRSRQPGTNVLPASLFELFGRPSTHWVGNINVLIGLQAVERHLAQALRIYPGSTNLAMFIIGDRPDQYQFTLSGSGADWDAELIDFSHKDVLLRQRTTASECIPQFEWVAMEPRRFILLAMSPPVGCELGSIDVHVRQRSTGRKAVVEFSLDPNAAGPGCFTA